MLTISEIFLVGSIVGVDHDNGNFVVQTFDADKRASLHKIDAGSSFMLAITNLQVGSVVKLIAPLSIVDGRASIEISDKVGRLAVIEAAKPDLSKNVGDAAKAVAAEAAVENKAGDHTADEKSEGAGASKSSSPATPSEQQSKPAVKPVSGFQPFGGIKTPAPTTSVAQTKTSVADKPASVGAPVAVVPKPEVKKAAPSFTMGFKPMATPAPAAKPTPPSPSSVGLKNLASTRDSRAPEPIHAGGAEVDRRERPSGPDDLDSMIPF